MTYTIPFSQLDKDDSPSAGGKGVNLGEMTAAGFPVPPGFVLTTAAYDAFVSRNGLQQEIIELASKTSVDDRQTGEQASAAIQKLMLTAEMPEAVRVELLAAYSGLATDGGGHVAVRSSAIAEGLPATRTVIQQAELLSRGWVGEA